jgi:hypothetical protein
MVLLKYTERAIYKTLTAFPFDTKYIMLMHGGKLLRVSACESKTRSGVKYNKLIRLSKKLRGRYG